MLLLAEIVNRTTVMAGQVIIPLSNLNLDWDNLEEIFQQTIAEYERYKPLVTLEVLKLSPEPTPVPYVKRVISIRPFISGFYEHINPLDFRDWQLYRGNLTSILRGSFMVEYLGSYRRLNYGVSYEQTEIVAMEREFKFRLRGHYKKGTLIFSIPHPTLTLEIKEDFASYKQLSLPISSISGNTITITGTDGELLSTGSQVKIKAGVGAVLPTPTSGTVTYSVIKISDTQFQLATSIPNALNNVPLTLTSTGTGTLTLETVVIPPYVNLIGSIGYGTLNLNTLKVELNLIGSYPGILNINFTSLYSAVAELDINNVTFNNLFKGNLMMSSGIIKEILKLPDLPFDFTADALYNRGEKIKEKADQELIDTGTWYIFRA